MIRRSEIACVVSSYLLNSKWIWLVDRSPSNQACGRSANRNHLVMNSDQRYSALYNMQDMLDRQTETVASRFTEIGLAADGGTKMVPPDIVAQIRISAQWVFSSSHSSRCYSNALCIVDWLRIRKWNNLWFCRSRAPGHSPMVWECFDDRTRRNMAGKALIGKVHIRINEHCLNVSICWKWMQYTGWFLCDFI